MSTTRMCGWCGGVLTGRQRNADYCSDAHRLRAWRARQPRPQQGSNGKVFEFPAGHPARPCHCEGGPLLELEDDGSWSCFRCGSHVQSAEAAAA